MPRSKDEPEVSLCVGLFDVCIHICDGRHHLSKRSQQKQSVVNFEVWE